MLLCQAKIQQGPRNGELCGRLTDSMYCSKHIRQTIIDKSISDNIRYCDIARGCYTVLEEHQCKCIHCLHKAKIRDRKREDKKRQDPNLCLDCGNTLTDKTRAKGKHDKSLRRCVHCYEKLKQTESQREQREQIKPRERNYKAEAFINKYVAWNHYIKSAKKRGINFTISKILFNSLISQKCHYCDYFKDGEVNGIDRVDNNLGYIDENVVSCCQACNIMKGSQHPQEFIDKLQTIYLFKTIHTPIKKSLVDKWKTTYVSKNIPNYKTYSKSANSRNIKFELSEDDFSNIIKKSCYLCGLETSDNNTNGIDRFENLRGYTLDNSRSCCGHCNILKKDLLYSKIIEISEKISNKYEELTILLNNKNISIRISKVEGRIKIDDPITQLTEERHYKLNEIIIPKMDIPSDIQSLLEKNKLVENIVHKQWKVKQIYEAITSNNENLYKVFCENNNDMSKITDWNIKWARFVLAIKDTTIKDSESIIREFIEDLRRIRHNELCIIKSNIVDREDRKQWPSITIVKAFLDGKIDIFKKYTEEQTGDNPDDIIWQKRWHQFINSLNGNNKNENKLKSLCSKFLAAQRIKRYRNKK